MKLSQRFLKLVQQQLSGFESEEEIQQLVVYVAQSIDGEAPTLKAVGYWPILGNVLPPVETDSELRTPSSNRRWYPLQEGSILLGALRAERFTKDQVWPEPLDQRLKVCADSISQFLGLELDRIRLLEELDQQREQIGLMVHQLRNPLAALRTYAQLLLRKLGPESNHRVLIEGLLTEQDQLNKFVSALDELSQAQLTSSQAIPSPLLLPPVLSKGPSLDVRSLLEPLIDRAEATANLQGRKWHGPQHWPSWTTQPRPSGDGVIAEIVANLLENAFRYSPPSSPVGLLLKEEGICVWDGGVSIPENERDKIFLKGIRGDNTDEIEGSGIGLALGRQLSKQLEGDLQLVIPPFEVDQSLPKGGNAFLLELPTRSLPVEKT